MTKSAFTNVYEKIPNGAIAHIKTSNNEKLCIKDNNDSLTSGINLNVYDEYIEIISIALTEKKSKTTMTSISYENITQVEYSLTTETEHPEKSDNNE